MAAAMTAISFIEAIYCKARWKYYLQDTQQMVDHYGHQKFPKSFRPDASKAFLGADLTLTVTAAEIESPLPFLSLAVSLSKTELRSSACMVGSYAACSWPYPPAS